jgi:hypothetical protein
VAARYDVVADTKVADEAKTLLIKPAWARRPTGSLRPSHGDAAFPGKGDVPQLLPDRASEEALTCRSERGARRQLTAHHRPNWL